MRITLHAVAADDRPTLAGAMRPTLRAAGLGDRRFLESGLGIDAFEAMVEEVVAFAERPVRRADVEACVAERVGCAVEPGVWRALRTVAPLVHAPADEPWGFGRAPKFVAAPQRAMGEAAPEVATRELLLRYLSAFGPATRRDLAQVALLRQRDLGTVWDALEGDLVRHEGDDGADLYDLPAASLPDADAAAPPRLMAMWDSVLLAYADRSRVIPPAYRLLVIRRNGDVLPTVLVDGFVSGVWRHVEDGVEVSAFEPLREAAWDGLEAEAQGLLALFDGRDDAVYGRFEHWWQRLEGEQVRVLGRRA